MKKTILITLLFVGLLVGCANGKGSNSDTEPLPDITGGGETSDTSGGGNTNTGGGETSIDGTVTIDGAIPAGWTYTSNNPTDYPNPEFYSDGGLKLNYFPMSLKSPTFPASAKTVVLAGKLNANTRTSGAATTLSIYTVSGTTETLVRSAVFSAKDLKTYSESYSLPAGTTQFVIKLIANVGYNVNVNTITIS